MQKTEENAGAASERADSARILKKAADTARGHFRYAKHVESFRARRSGGTHRPLCKSFHRRTGFMSQECEDALLWNLDTGQLRIEANDQVRRLGLWPYT